MTASHVVAIARFINGARQAQSARRKRLGRGMWSLPSKCAEISGDVDRRGSGATCERTPQRTGPRPGAVRAPNVPPRRVSHPWKNEASFLNQLHLSLIVRTTTAQPILRPMIGRMFKRPATAKTCDRLGFAKHLIRSALHDLGNKHNPVLSI